MQVNKSNAKLFELKSFSRKLNLEERPKDRLIIKHLRRRKNNFLFDFDEPNDRSFQSGVNYE
ncbi:hypothetical protein C2759_04420 [Polynucleobacter sp. MG-Unter2-18]|uniref:hypothetical protein n=1 Tax=Polynucleobacter sp. MG-Unter2-18 TaxID=2081052 RepID=UPI001BFE109E|nr:hypothetical protein [Polynucleobacter sp. MG-Unter2-18]QWD95372.1 hypothetical protein C2759_04420 [Polynucleobacter sp. MG-Unter2-18]